MGNVLNRRAANITSHLASCEERVALLVCRVVVQHMSLLTSLSDLKSRVCLLALIRHDRVALLAAVVVALKFAGVVTITNVDLNATFVTQNIRSALKRAAYLRFSLQSHRMTLRALHQARWQHVFLLILVH